MKLDLAARSEWTFQPEGEASAPRVLPVPYGGWRLNGFPTATAGVYRRRITVPALYAADMQTTLLEFEAVNWEAVVSVGPDEKHLREAGRHLSAWTPFQVDISRFVAPGQSALLQVRVRDRSHFVDKDGRFTVPAATEWNDRPARGIIRGVWLNALPAVHIADVFVRPNTRANTLTYEATVANDSARPQTVILSGALTPATPGAKWTYPRLPDRRLTLPPHSRTTATFGPIRWTPGRAAWWWPNVPYRPDYRAQLHNLNLRLLRAPSNGGAGAQAVVHEQTARFGFCMPGQEGNRYTLNGVRINLRGDSLPEGTIGTDAFARLPGFLPPSKTNPGWPGAVRNYQKLNFNVVRMHQVPCTRYMMDVCDELGLLVIPETAIRGGGIKKENIEAQPEAFAAHLRELIVRDRNHPSVFKWSLENELFGAPADFMRGLYDAARKADPTRPLSIDDNAEYPSWPGFAIIAHYNQPPGTPDAAGGPARADRPFGQGEFIWPRGNTPQGALWFGLTTRALRAHDNADIRPYTLLDVWPGVIPGLAPGNFPTPPLPPDGLEQGGSSLLAVKAPARSLELNLIQRSFAPVCAFDRDWDARNTPSNGRGVYPSVFPPLPAGQTITRTLTLFNDEFAGEDLELDVAVSALPAPDQRRPVANVARHVRVPLGGHSEVPVAFRAPDVRQNQALEMRIIVRKNGMERFREFAYFTLQGAAGTRAEFAGRDDATRGNWQGKYGGQAFLLPMRGGVAQFADAGITVQRGAGAEAARGNGGVSGDEAGEDASAEEEWDRARMVDDPRVPPSGNGLTERHPIAFRGKASLALRVDARDGKPHQAALYLLDYKRKGLAVDVDVFDEQGHPLDTRRVENYGEGAYLRYRFTGSIVLVVRTLKPEEFTVASGLFVDSEAAN